MPSSLARVLASRYQPRPASGVHPVSHEVTRTVAARTSTPRTRGSLDARGPQGCQVRPAPRGHRRVRRDLGRPSSVGAAPYRVARQVVKPPSLGMMTASEVTAKWLTLRPASTTG